MPSNSSFFITLPGVQLQVREFAFFLLPIVNLLCRSKNKVWIADRKLKSLIAWFLIIIIFTELFKHLYFDEGLGNVFKTIRIGLPLFSSLLLVYTGIRADIKKVWRTLLWAISVSSVLTLITPFVFLPIYPSIEGENILEAAKGRLMNSNASFGIIGVYLLYKDKNHWYNNGMLPKLTALLSIAVLILTFNRTYLALLVLAFLYLSFTEFSLRKAFKIISIPIVAIIIFLTVYNFSEVIQRQVDKRIFDIVLGTTLLKESVYENNREGIYDGIINRINEGYWAFGLPYTTEIFVLYKTDGTIYKASKTDVSIINVLLRYGLVPLIFFLLILLRTYRLDFEIVKFAILLYSLGSLNIDSLLAHNSIMFLLILLFISRTIRD